MPIYTYITDPSSGEQASVSTSGALSVGPPQPSRTYNATLGMADTPVEVVSAVGGRRFCITGFILTGNKNISTSVDAVVTIYTSTGPASDTVVTQLITIPVARSGQTVITGVLIEAEVGHFINGNTTDDDVLVTILGFYI